MIMGDEYGSELLEKYKRQLYKIFYPSNIVRTGFSLERAKLVLSDFSDICGDSKWYGNIDAKFYNALGDAYHKFSGFGWGMDDYIIVNSLLTI